MKHILKRYILKCALQVKMSYKFSTYLCEILASILRQFARMKPTLPTRPVRYQEETRKSRENINIFPLYLDSEEKYVLDMKLKRLI